MSEVHKDLCRSGAEKSVGSRSLGTTEDKIRSDHASQDEEEEYYVEDCYLVVRQSCTLLQ